MAVLPQDVESELADEARKASVAWDDVSPVSPLWNRRCLFRVGSLAYPSLTSSFLHLLNTSLVPIRRS